MGIILVDKELIAKLAKEGWKEIKWQEGIVNNQGRLVSTLGGGDSVKGYFWCDNCLEPKQLCCIKTGEPKLLVYASSTYTRHKPRENCRSKKKNNGIGEADLVDEEEETASNFSTDDDLSIYHSLKTDCQEVEEKNEATEDLERKLKERESQHSQEKANSTGKHQQEKENLEIERNTLLIELEKKTKALEQLETQQATRESQYSREIERLTTLNEEAMRTAAENTKVIKELQRKMKERESILLNIIERSTMAWEKCKKDHQELNDLLRSSITAKELSPSDENKLSRWMRNSEINLLKLQQEIEELNGDRYSRFL